MGSIKKLDSHTKKITGRADEKAVREFIAQLDKPAEGDATRKSVLIRFDAQLLKRVDTAAKRRGISRSGWIQFTVSHALDRGEG